MFSERDSLPFLPYPFTLKRSAGIARAHTLSTHALPSDDITGNAPNTAKGEREREREMSEQREKRRAKTSEKKERRDEDGEREREERERRRRGIDVGGC